MIRTGFAREIITPKLGVSLCGYFNPRPKDGKYDDLYVRVMVLEAGGVRTAVFSYDLCFVGLQIVAELRAALKKAGLVFAERSIFCATHTHTGPYAKRFFGAEPDPDFLAGLVAKTVSAAKIAEANLAETEVFQTRTKCTSLAFNRRYWMKSGIVMTNPGKLNAEIDRPEGPVDYEIPVLAFKQHGRIVTIVSNIVNHSDTIGGETVSADWPGRYERAVQDALGYDVNMLTLIGCSGNINHFDTTWNDPQTSYEEATRIGKGYAEVLVNALPTLKPLAVEKITFDAETVNFPFSIITEEQLEKARQTLARVGNATSDKNLTSEGLASGEGPVARFFAEQLISYHQTCSGKSRDFVLSSIKFDASFAMVSLPGEPFTEIGLYIKQHSRFPMTMVAALANGALGYIPLKDCFSRGGYEILPVEDGTPMPGTAERLMEEGTKLVNR